MLGRNEGSGRRGRQRMRWLDAITDSMDMSLSKLRETVKDREAWHAAGHGANDALSEQTMAFKAIIVGFVILNFEILAV